MPSGFLSKFARDKSSPSGAKQQHQQQQQPLRQSPRAPAPPPTTTTTTTPTPAVPQYHSSIDSSASTPTVANSSAGGSGSSASSSLIAGRASQSALGQSRTLSTILGGEDFQRQEHQQQQGGDATAMSLQQKAVAEASAGVAMAGIPVVNVHGVDGQQQQDVQGGARQMSVDMMDVSGLSLTNQGNERQAGGAGGGDVSMREKMEAAQLQVRSRATSPRERLLIHSCRRSKHRRQRSTQRSRPALRR